MSAVLEPPRRSVEVSLCPLEEIALGMGRSFEVAGRVIAVFRKRSGEIHAVDGTCPHRGAPLVDGIIAGDRVVCPFHAMRFDLKSGNCDRPETCPIQVYAASVRDGWIHISIAA